MENLAVALPDGPLVFQMQRLAESARLRSSSRDATPHCSSLSTSAGAWLADLLARLQVRYPEVPVIFADSRRSAEEWTYRFLAAALAESRSEARAGHGLKNRRTRAVRSTRGDVLAVV